MQHQYPRTEAVAKEIYHAWGVLLEDAQKMEADMQAIIDEQDRQLKKADKERIGLIGDSAAWQRQLREKSGALVESERELTEIKNKYRDALKTIDALNEAAIDDIT